MDDELQGWMTHVKLLVIVAGILGCVQALTWTCLTITGLVYYADCNVTKNSLQLQTFADILRVFYFAESNCTENATEKPTANVENNVFKVMGRRIESSDLQIWFCIILAFSVIWMITSALMIASVRDKLNKQASYFIIAWSSTTLIVCVIDLALGILLGLDLGGADVGDVPDYQVKMKLVQFAIGVMMTISFKGYILWILNFAFAIVLLSASVQILKPEEDILQELPSNNVMARKPINAYESSQDARPAPWLLNTPRPQLNSQLSGYSMYSGYQGEVNSGYTGMEGPRFQQQQPLASIMKKSVADAQRDQVNKPRMRNEPNLPSPDYSPPPVRPRPPYKQPSESSQSHYNNPYRR